MLNVRVNYAVYPACDLYYAKEAMFQARMKHGFTKNRGCWLPSYPDIQNLAREVSDCENKLYPISEILGVSEETLYYAGRVLVKRFWKNGNDLTADEITWLVLNLQESAEADASERHGIYGEYYDGAVARLEKRRGQGYYDGYQQYLRFCKYEWGEDPDDFFVWKSRIDSIDDKFIQIAND